MPADRSSYGDQQADLLRALLSGERFPEGFAIDDAAAASRSLVGKRARLVANEWPALTQSLGGEFTSRFEAFARRAPPPSDGAGLADGYAFARSLARRTLSDDARAELLLMRGAISQRGDGFRQRRWMFVGAARLRDPHRVLLVFHLPVIGRRHAVARFGPG